MSVHSLNVPLLVGNSVPTSEVEGYVNGAVQKAQVDIGPDYEFQRADLGVTWAVNRSFITNTDSLTIAGLEDSDKDGNPVVWSIKITFLSSGNKIVGGKPAATFRIADDADPSLNYPTDVEFVDPAVPPEYGPTYLAQTKALHDDVVAKAAEVDAVAATTVTTGAVVGDNLVLTRTDATTVVAGNVRGPQGEQGEQGDIGLPGVNAVANDTATAGYVNTPSSATATALADKFAPLFTSKIYPIEDFILTGETLSLELAWADTTGYRSAALKNSQIVTRAQDALNTAYLSDGKPRQIELPDGMIALGRQGGSSTGAGSKPYGVARKSGVGFIGRSRNRKVAGFTDDGRSTPLIFDGSDANFIYDLRDEFITVDAGNVTAVRAGVTDYTARFKALYMTYIERYYGNEVAFNNSWGSAFGCDFFRNSEIGTIYASVSGRGFADIGISPEDPVKGTGGSLLGIGTKYAEEGLYIDQAFLSGAGKNAIFYETQDGANQAKGHHIRYAQVTDSRNALNDCGANGLRVDFMDVINPVRSVISLEGTVLVAEAGRNGNVKARVRHWGAPHPTPEAGAALVIISDQSKGGYTIDIDAMDTPMQVLKSTSASKWAAGVHVNMEIAGAGSGVVIDGDATISELTLTGNLKGVTGQAVEIKQSTTDLSVDLELRPNGVQTGGLTFTGTSKAMTGARIRGDARTQSNPFASTHSISADTSITMLFSGTTPTALRVSNHYNNDVTLAWNAPLGVVVTDYTIQYRDLTSGGAWTAVSHTASPATSILVTMPTMDHQYEYRVAAVSSAGTSGWSSSVLYTTQWDAAIVDLYNRLDGTIIGASAPDGPVGATYEMIGGGTSPSFGIVAGFVKATAGTNTGFAALPVGERAAKIEFTFSYVRPTTGSGPRFGIGFRISDSSNYFRLVCQTTKSYQLQKVIAGTPTTLWTSTNPWAAAAVITITDDGTQFDVYENGVKLTTTPIADGSSLRTAYKVGPWGQWNNSSNVEVDHDSKGDNLRIYKVKPA